MSKANSYITGFTMLCKELSLFLHFHPSLRRMTRMEYSEDRKKEPVFAQSSLERQSNLYFDGLCTSTSTGSAQVLRSAVGFASLTG